jgi:hypothetical protein
MMRTTAPIAPAAPSYTSSSSRAPSTVVAAPAGNAVGQRPRELPELRPSLAHVLDPLASSRQRRPARRFSLDEQMFVEMQHGCHG